MTNKTNLYSKDYFTSITEKSRTVFEKYKSIIEKAIKLDNLNICDIGCAQGNFIEGIYKNSNCYGYDISDDAIKKCKERFPDITERFKVMDLNNESLSENIPNLDLITMFDVIEHLENYTFLRVMLKTKLKTGGYFVLTTPNSNSLLRFITPKSFTGEIDKTHISLFTPYTLDFLLRRAGLQKVILATPFPFYLKTNFITKNFLIGEQIFAIYKKV